MFVIPIENQHSYQSIPRNGDLRLTINNRCNVPSHTLLVDWKGDCFVCSCEAWLPVSAGNILDIKSLNDFWSTGVPAELQQDINQKKFTHCAVDRCGILNNSIEEKIYTISINIDASCNLICPSCRKESVMVDSGPEYDLKLRQVNHLIDLLEEFDRPCRIVMSGNGDPLSSPIMRPLLHRFKPGVNQQIRLFTNGLLLEKQLRNNPIVDNINQYFISVDAGSSEVYEQVRYPGRYNILLKNFDFLKELIDITAAEVLLMFVLQRSNYHDMAEFAELCIRYGFNGVINRLEDWGTWDSFDDQDVIGNVNHPLHAESIAELKRIYNKYNQRIQFNASLVQLATEIT